MNEGVPCRFGAVLGGEGNFLNLGTWVVMQSSRKRRECILAFMQSPPQTVGKLRSCNLWTSHAADADTGPTTAVVAVRVYEVLVYCLPWFTVRARYGVGVVYV